ASGSTLRSRWVDPIGDGQLRVGPGEPLADRLELGPRAAPGAVLATLAHMTDSHVLDAASPARVPFLDRLGNPFESTFRPHETLTTQVLAGAVAAIGALAPQLVIQGGDLIDNDQRNELEHALAVLRGGSVRPGSGPNGYYGVQSALNPDPFYYRPEVDAPRHSGLLRRATRAFASPGLRALWAPVLGDHDILVAGEIVPTSLTTALALGSRALWDLPRGLSLPPGAKLSAGSSPDGPPVPGLVDELLAKALAGPTVPVPADPARAEMFTDEVLTRLRIASSRVPISDRGAPDRLDYTVDLGSHVRLIVLDLARRAGGSGGLVVSAQPTWLKRALAGAEARWVIVVSHQPLTSSTGGDQLLAILDRAPRVIATLAGHTHRNRIEPRPTAAGGYWLITTASLIDFPQQTRAISVIATEGGGVALRTWMLDHVFPGDLGTISRSLAYLDAQGGRPQDFAGSRLDRNVTLYRRASG
ncbi:MAG: metallophosphoesterase, partial [Actinomycetota bacterium]|nr:metallophosphoesterase [Actinomycetota bacterium]